MRQHKSVIIVGGSIVGPATAALLHNDGWHVTLIEAIPPTVSMAGGVIGLRHETWRALAELGVTVEEVVDFQDQEIEVWGLENQVVRAQRATTFDGFNTTWTNLHHALDERVPAGVMRIYQRVLGVENNVVRLADGQELTADLVVGADGRGSTLRRAYDPRRELSYAYPAFRGTTPYHPISLRHAVSITQPGFLLNLFPVINKETLTVGIDWTMFVPTSPEYLEQLTGYDPLKRLYIPTHLLNDDARAYTNSVAGDLLPETFARIVTDTEERALVTVVDIPAPDKMFFRFGGRKPSFGVLLGDALAPQRPHTAAACEFGLRQAVGLRDALRKHHGDLEGALTRLELSWVGPAAEKIELGPKLGELHGLSGTPA